MSGSLWKYYFENDLDNFGLVLETASYTNRPQVQRGFGQQSVNAAGAGGSPGRLSTSPTLSRASGRSAGVVLTRANLNWRDSSGLTLLHHISSSTEKNAIDFASALLELPLTDLYVQDVENGWTALHRAFYFGNITIARAILDRDASNAFNVGTGVQGHHHAGGLIKVKDKDGHAPFELYAATIKERDWFADSRRRSASTSSEEDDDELAQEESGDCEDSRENLGIVPTSIDIRGDELFTFGSNKNVSLGFGDEDDRQYPERIVLRRPDHLFHKFCQNRLGNESKRRDSSTQHVETSIGSHSGKGASPNALPTSIRYTPTQIQDVQMSKLHTAVLTSDPQSNLYMCGHGLGGRLGTGDQTTRYQFTCIEGGALAQKKVVAIALGQNHSLALSDQGEIFTWGGNKYGQLGYTLPEPNVREEDPVQTVPRQIFGPLKREVVIGISASRIHSVAHTSISLYSFGKNEGQLGIVDSDARSLQSQLVPRKVAASLFSSSIKSVSAIERATVCLLENRDVWVFANYGYAKLHIPLGVFSNYFLGHRFSTKSHMKVPHEVSKIQSGGDTICVLTATGEVFTVAVNQRNEPVQGSSTSTTNPSKIRGALSAPNWVWSLRKSHMAARDVAVDQDGSIILTTAAGTVWRRVTRAKIKDASAAGIGTYKPKDYKFSRVPGLTGVVAVRASAFGAYAAVRKDCDFTRTHITVPPRTLPKDFSQLLSFRDLASDVEKDEVSKHRSPSEAATSVVDLLQSRIKSTRDLEAVVSRAIDGVSDALTSTYDMEICTSLSEVRIPIHQFVIASRSRVVRDGLASIRQTRSFSVPDVCTIQTDGNGKVTLELQGFQFLTLINLVLYVYVDAVANVWLSTRHISEPASLYRQIRSEHVKLAARLDLLDLELALRHVCRLSLALSEDMEEAIKDGKVFQSADVLVQLEDAEIKVHRGLVCQRCPFFQGLFNGRSGGQWLAGRADMDTVRVDFKHVKSTVFQYVLRHIYADTGEELFDETVTTDLDEFIDLVMDVMSVANELILHRLSKVCQKVIGRYGKYRAAKRAFAGLPYQ